MPRSWARCCIQGREASRPAYSTFIRPQGSRPSACRDARVISRNTWNRRYLRRSFAWRPPACSRRATSQTSGINARDSASSLSSRSSRCATRSPMDCGLSLMPSAMRARSRKRRAWSFIQPAWNAASCRLSQKHRSRGRWARCTMSWASTCTSATLMARTGRAGSRYRPPRGVLPVDPHDRQLVRSPGRCSFCRTASSRTVSPPRPQARQRGTAVGCAAPQPRQKWSGAVRACGAVVSSSSSAPIKVSTSTTRRPPSCFSWCSQQVPPARASPPPGVRLVKVKSLRNAT